MVLTRKEQPSGRIGMRMSRRRILGGAGCRRWPNHVMRHANIVKNTCGPNSKPLHSTPHQSSSSCHFTFSPQTDCINYQQIIFAAQKATFISDYAWTKESGSLDSGLRMLHNSRVASVARHMLLPLADASVDAMWIEMAILTWSRTNLSERSRASVHSAKNYK